MSKRDIAPGDPRFSVTCHKGFQLTFANGIVISVQWGPGNYCADYWDDVATDYNAPKSADYWNSPDAEVALFYADPKPDLDRDWLTRKAFAALNDGKDCGDDVIPALSPDEVARYVAWAASQPKVEA